jgi:hypothetical protein
LHKANYNLNRDNNNLKRDNNNLREDNNNLRLANKAIDEEKLILEDKYAELLRQNELLKQENNSQLANFKSFKITVDNKQIRLAYVIEELKQTGMSLEDAVKQKKIDLYYVAGPVVAGVIRQPMPKPIM